MEENKPKDQDDEIKKETSGDSHEEADDFGLPEASSDIDADTEDTEDAGNDSYEEDSDIFSGDRAERDQEESHTYKYHSTHDDRQRNPVGLIISFVLIGIIVIAIAIYWFFFREPVKKQVVERVPVEEVKPPPPKIEEQPQETVVETPEVVQEAAPRTTQPRTSEPRVVDEEGSFEAINQPTGRYYIVLNSFIDSDLAEDYAQHLAGDGVDTKIIPPSEPMKGFHRVVLSDEYSTWQAAEANLGNFKSVFGESIWVLRY